MDNFIKPYYENAKECKFPYDSELLKDYPIFPLYIMDGGAHFIATEIFGSGWNGDTIADYAMSGKLLDRWTIDGKFDWDLPYKLYQKSNVCAPLEWFVWINRLYFIIPLANKFLKTKDEKYAQKWLYYFDEWRKAHPYIEMKEDDNATEKSVWSSDKNISQTVAGSEGYISSLVWRDMQVTWRLLAIIHSIEMLSESKSITKDKWQEIYDFLKLHSTQLLLEGKKYSKMQSLHNHVLQMGTALIYMGCLFPEMPDSEEFLLVGKKLIEIQLAGAIDVDGGSNETCISYSHFIVRYYIECYLLLEKNGHENIKGLKESIEKQYNWIYQMSTPNGRTLIFNDAYSFDTLRDIEIAKKLIDFNIEPKMSKVFTASKCGVLRNENFDLYFDGMKLSQVHQHAGRPNFVLYCHGKPVIADSGCPCYDNHGLHKYLLGEFAHNTVCLYKDEPKDRNLRATDEIEILGFDNDFVKFKISGKREDVEFTRIRTININNEKVTITDELEMAEEMTAESRIHLSAIDLTQEDNIIYIHDMGTENDITVTVSGNDTTAVDYKPAVNEKGEFTYSPVIVAKTKGKKAIISYEVSL